MENQYTNTIMMVRPAGFVFNAETATSNSFQTADEAGTSEAVSAKALQEFDNMVLKLKEKGINIIVMHDTPTPLKPDAIFPNNWVTFHHNGTIITYPMHSANRRTERREDIIDALGLLYKSTSRYSFEVFEESNQFLEGTGSMILDRPNKIVYACLSPRTDIFLLDKFCLLMGYQLVSFYALDDHGKEIYHTNVMLTVADNYAIVCLECIRDEDKRKEVADSLTQSGKEVIEISMAQVMRFAGNMLQVASIDNQKYLVMSDQAYKSLSPKQIERIETHNAIIAIPIYTIEKYGGGSTRCMMAEIFLPKK